MARPAGGQRRIRVGRRARARTEAPPRPARTRPPDRRARRGALLPRAAAHGRHAGGPRAPPLLEGPLLPVAAGRGDRRLPAARHPDGYGERLPAASLQAYGGAIADVPTPTAPSASATRRSSSSPPRAGPTPPRTRTGCPPPAATPRRSSRTRPACTNAMSDEGATGVARAYSPAKLARLPRAQGRLRPRQRLPPSLQRTTSTATDSPHLAGISREILRFCQGAVGARAHQDAHRLGRLRCARVHARGHVHARRAQPRRAGGRTSRPCATCACFFQYANVHELCEPVERLTGRKVHSFLSAVDTQGRGPLAVETFVLYPEGKDGPSRSETEDSGLPISGRRDAG